MNRIYSSTKLMRRQWEDDDKVVRRHVEPGHPVPIFAEDIWDLSCLSRTRKQGKVVLDFSEYPPSRKRALKELMAHRLNSPTYSARADNLVQFNDATTCRARLRQFKQLSRFMDDEHLGGFAQLERKHVAAYTSANLRSDRAPHANAHVLGTLVWLWESRDVMTDGGLTFDPWDGRGAKEVAGSERSDETATPRIPEAVIAQLLRWALAYVTHFSKDILTARAALASADDPKRENAGTVDNAERFAAYVERLRSRRTRLPGILHMGRKDVCRRLVSADSGAHLAWLNGQKGNAALMRAKTDLGVDLRPLGRIEQGTNQGVIAWRPFLSFDELQKESQRLVTACYVVCAYLSGMRDVEVQDLKYGCLATELDDRGVVRRFRVRGNVFKDHKSPKERTWVVIEPVADAIRVLERLHDEGKTREDKLLFVRLTRFGTAKSLIGPGIVRHLNEFASHCSDQLAPWMADLPEKDGEVQENLCRIPDGPMGPWHFTTRQFRKTLAWHIANVPFGTVAGMIQYGHTAIMMFEGYAGTSESDFRAEVEIAEALARLDGVVEMFDDSRRGIRPAGPMADELSAEFLEIAASIGSLPGEVVDGRRMEEFLRHRSTQMRFGVYNHCFFEPSQAQCLLHLPQDQRVEPLIGVCDPTCSNACWTRRHLPSWETLRKEAEEFAKVNRISRLQRDHAKRTVRECEVVIRAIEGDDDGQALH